MELHYLSYLGFWRPQKYRQYTQKELLQKYKDTMHLRKNWGNIDIYAVIEHILKLLEYGQAYASKDVTDIEYWDKQFEKTTSDASKNAVEELELKKASD